jgi:group I intron endonuclease
MNYIGVYAFSGLVQTKSFETPIYVGSSKDVEGRYYKHQSSLELDSHPNLPLLHYLKKYGAENLVFLGLEETEKTKEDLLRAEQKYIDYYGIAANKEAFNILPTAGSILGHKRGPLSEEQKAYLRSISMGEDNHFYGKNHDLKAKFKMRDFQRDRKLPDETKLKMSEARIGEKNPMWGKKGVKIGPKTYYFFDPDGNKREIFNLEKFCRDNELSSGSMRLLNKNRLSEYKGWKKYE